MTRWRSLLFVGGIAAAALPSLRSGGTREPSAVVRVGPFRDKLIESGTIAAAHTDMYSAPVGTMPWRILALAPEGQSIGAGDLLVRFDTAALEAERAREAGNRQAASADRLRTREELRFEVQRGDADVQAARERVTFAEQALANDIDGRGRLELVEADAAATDAQREAAHARKTYDDLKPLLAEGFITRAELDRAEQASARADAAASIAALRLKTLREFQQPATAAKSRAEVVTAREGLGRSTDAAKGRLAQAQAAAALADSRLAESDARLAALDAQIAAATVRARAPGLVVYRDGYFGAERRKPQVGDQVASNQPVVTVPDLARLVVEIRVREIDVSKIAVAQRVIVRADAFPEIAAPGEVAAIGALAMEDPGRVGTRFFPVTVTLDPADRKLRPGMTARVEVPTTTIARALVVPAAAVLSASDGATYCLVVEGGRTVRRDVSVIAATDTEAAVAGALSAGTRVSLANR